MDVQPASTKTNLSGFRGIAASRYVALCAAFSAIGGFLFGYEYVIQHSTQIRTANTLAAKASYLLSLSWIAFSSVLTKFPNRPPVLAFTRAS